MLRLILDSKDTVALIDSYEFAADSLYCEWCYVVDLDAECLEVYTGFNKRPLDPGERFANLSAPPPEAGSDTYYPVRLLHTFSFDEIAVLSADEFTHTLNADHEARTAEAQALVAPSSAIANNSGNADDD